jgi:hypothetical protein
VLELLFLHNLIFLCSCMHKNLSEIDQEARSSCVVIRTRICLRLIRKREEESKEKKNDEEGVPTSE